MSTAVGALILSRRLPRGGSSVANGANETQIERAGVHLLSYTAPGSEHAVLSDESFHTEQVNGQRFLDWATKLIEHRPVNNVHCQQCRVG
jgi:hypothetical protein